MGKGSFRFKLEDLPPAMRAEAERQLASTPVVNVPEGASAVHTKIAAPSEKAKRSLAVKFESAWESMQSAPRYATEVQVVPDRQWRYDYCWLEAKVALELQGGIYMAGKGGHVSPKGFRADCDKLNASNLAGVVVFKLATGQITPDNIVMLRDFIITRLNGK